MKVCRNTPSNTTLGHIHTPRGQAKIVTLPSGCLYVTLPNGLQFPINRQIVNQWFKTGYAKQEIR